MDVSRHVHNLPNTPHKPKRRQSTHFNDIGLDYIENTKDMSPRRVLTFQLAVDTPSSIHDASHDSHNLTRRKSKCSNEISAGYHGNTKDTSPGRVPLSLSAVDIPKNVHNTYSDPHNPMHRYSTRLDASVWKSDSVRSFGPQSLRPGPRPVHVFSDWAKNRTEPAWTGPERFFAVSRPV